MLPEQSTKLTVGIALKVISATKEPSIQSLATQVTHALKTQRKNTHVTLDSIALKVATSRLIALQATTARPIELYEYEKCGNGTYCPPKSSAPMNCPAGSFGTGRTDNYDLPTSCVSCGRGQYSA
jgi:hypothetical protein